MLATLEATPYSPPTFSNETPEEVVTRLVKLINSGGADSLADPLTCPTIMLPPVRTATPMFAATEKMVPVRPYELPQRYRNDTFTLERVLTGLHKLPDEPAHPARGRAPVGRTFAPRRPPATWNEPLSIPYIPGPRQPVVSPRAAPAPAPLTVLQRPRNPNRRDSRQPGAYRAKITPVTQQIRPGAPSHNQEWCTAGVLAGRAAGRAAVKATTSRPSQVRPADNNTNYGTPTTKFEALRELDQAPLWTEKPREIRSHRAERTGLSRLRRAAVRLGALTAAAFFAIDGITNHLNY